MDKQLVALYELKRQSLLLGYVQNPSMISDGLAFAYENRVAPVLHENIAREVHGGDPFEDVHSVKADFVLDVLKHVDELDKAGNYKDLAFYNMEDHYGGRGIRVELIHALEYIRIDGRFDDKVWKAVEANAPAEANRIASSFSAKDVCSTEKGGTPRSKVGVPSSMIRFIRSTCPLVHGWFGFVSRCSILSAATSAIERRSIGRTRRTQSYFQVPA